MKKKRQLFKQIEKLEAEVMQLKIEIQKLVTVDRCVLKELQRNNHYTPFKADEPTEFKLDDKGILGVPSIT